MGDQVESPLQCPKPNGDNYIKDLLQAYVISDGIRDKKLRFYIFLTVCNNFAMMMTCQKNSAEMPKNSRISCIIDIDGSIFAAEIKDPCQSFNFFSEQCKNLERN